MTMFNGRLDAWNTWSAETQTYYPFAPGFIAGSGAGGKVLIRRRVIGPGGGPYHNLPDGLRYYLELEWDRQATSGDPEFPDLMTIVEWGEAHGAPASSDGVRWRHGQRLKMSFHGQCASGPVPFKMRGWQSFGYEGFGQPPSPTVHIHSPWMHLQAQSNGATPQFQYFEHIFDLPSVFGKQIGGAGYDYFGVGIDIPWPYAPTLRFADFTLEPAP